LVNEGVSIVRTHLIVACVCTAVLAPTGVGRAQDSPAPAKTTQVVPLKVQVVISRYKGEARISSVPYAISLTASGQMGSGRVRIGTQVPLPGAPPAAPAAGAPTASPITYRDIGTNIDCVATLLPEGRFQLDITVDQSSIRMGEPSAPDLSSVAPTFNSFRMRNSAVFTDGKTAQFTTATDSITGEVVRVDVTLTVIK
jgi:hypothetical protein